MTRSSRLAVTVAAVTALSALAAPAFAYEFKEGDNGEPLRWFIPETTVRVSTVAPAEVPWAEMQPLVVAAYAAWDIPGAAVPQVDVVGTTDARDITTPTALGQDPDNIVIFYKTSAQWRTVPMSQSTMIALTIIASNDQTGEIVDADIAMNDGGFTFSTDDDAPDSHIDLLAALTHEAGHFFGLDHSADADATMYASYGDDPSRRLTARTLADDDEAGVTALYNLPIPEPDVSTPGDDGNGCASSSAPAGGLAAAFAVLALLALRRRRA